jgi:hypothetical protein
MIIFSNNIFIFHIGETSNTVHSVKEIHLSKLNFIEKDNDSFLTEYEVNGYDLIKWIVVHVSIIKF